MKSLMNVREPLGSPGLSKVTIDSGSVPTSMEI